MFRDFFKVHVHCNHIHSSFRHHAYTYWSNTMLPSKRMSSKKPLYLTDMMKNESRYFYTERYSFVVSIMTGSYFVRKIWYFQNVDKNHWFIANVNEPHSKSKQQKNVDRAPFQCRWTQNDDSILIRKPDNKNSEYTLSHCTSLPYQNCITYIWMTIWHNTMPPLLPNLLHTLWVK